jgi:hypothetical protein
MNQNTMLRSQRKLDNLSLSSQIEKCLAMISLSQETNDCTFLVEPFPLEQGFEPNDTKETQGQTANTCTASAFKRHCSPPLKHFFSL